jgi:hypothetical protein
LASVPGSGGDIGQEQGVVACPGQGVGGDAGQEGLLLILPQAPAGLLDRQGDAPGRVGAGRPQSKPIKRRDRPQAQGDGLAGVTLSIHGLRPAQEVQPGELPGHLLRALDQVPPGLAVSAASVGRWPAFEPLLEGRRPFHFRDRSLYIVCAGVHACSFIRCWVRWPLRGYVQVYFIEYLF